MPSYQEMPDLGWEPEVLEAKGKAVKRNALVGVAAGVASFFLFGIVLGAYAIYSARDALIDINVYNVGRNYKWVARAAQVLGGAAIILRLVGFALRFTGH